MKIATVTSDGLNVRMNPHEKAEKITALSKGDKVPVLAHKHFEGGYTWLQVELKDKRTGWVYAKHVTVTSKIPDEPPHIPVPDHIPDARWFVIGIGVVALIVGLLLVIQ